MTNPGSMKIRAGVSHTEVTITLSDSSTCEWYVKQGQMVADILKTDAVFCSLYTVERTSGPNVPGVLMSYGNDVSLPCRLLDIIIVPDKPELTKLRLKCLDQSSKFDLSKPEFQAAVSSCSNLGRGPRSLIRTLWHSAEVAGDYDAYDILLRIDASAIVSQYYSSIDAVLTMDEFMRVKPLIPVSDIEIEQASFGHTDAYQLFTFSAKAIP